MMPQTTVLVADPDAVWVESLTRLLRAEGYRVLAARTGVDALYQIRMRRPALALLAPELRQLSGWEVCRMLKQSPEGTATKIVLLTLYGDAAHQVGADGYLLKGGQMEIALPPVRVFRYPAEGVLREFLHRRTLAA
jgi:CheY-like chemotaxis protein